MQRSLVVVAAALIGVSPVAAQRPWAAPSDGNQLSITLTHAFTKDDQFGASNVLADIAGRWQLSPTMWFGAGVPIAHSDLNIASNPYYVPPRTSATEVGDPWLGFGARLQPGVSILVSVRPGFRKNGALDVAGAAAVIFAALADYDHFEAWGDHRSSIRAMLQFGAVPESGYFATGYLGGTVVPGQSGSATTPLVDYGVRIGVRSRTILAAAHLTGRIDGTSCDGCHVTFDDRMVNQAGLSIESMTGRVRPMASIGIFLDPSVRSDSPIGAGVHALVTAGAAVTM